MKEDVKKQVVDMIVKKMEETGKVPWDNGFLANNILPINHSTGKAYTGCNAFLLMVFGSGSNEYVTYRQCKALGGEVKKGEHGLPIIWYSLYNSTKKKLYDPKTVEKEDVVIPLIKKSTVFEISQCEGLTSTRNVKPRELVANPNEQIESWLESFKKNTELKVLHNLFTACYDPAGHTIYIRNIDEFKTDSAYYSTMFHECTHSTGHKLGRQVENRFGDNKYSQEEVIAEMGAMFMCNHFGIMKEQVDNSAVYVKSWGQHLKNNPNWLIKGVSLAEKAYDYMIEKGV